MIRRPDSRFRLDTARFHKAVRHAAVELNTTPHAICLECDIEPSTFSHFSKGTRSPSASTVLGLCSVVGLDPMAFLIDIEQSA